MYGKVINNELLSFDGTIIINNTIIINPTEDMIIKDGWKKVIYKEGNITGYIPVYNETEEFIYITFID